MVQCWPTREGGEQGDDKVIDVRGVMFHPSKMARHTNACPRCSIVALVDDPVRLLTSITLTLLWSGGTETGGDNVMCGWPLL